MADDFHTFLGPIPGTDVFPSFGTGEECERERGRREGEKEGGREGIEENQLDGHIINMASPTRMSGNERERGRERGVRNL